MNPELLLAHQDFVRALARHLAGNGADDLAQESWLRAMTRERPREGPLRAWLATIVRNANRDDVRRMSGRSRREQAVARAEAIPSTAEVVEREAARRQVVDAVLALPEPYRGVIDMRLSPSSEHRRENDLEARTRRGCAPDHRRRSVAVPAGRIWLAVGSEACRDDAGSSRPSPRIRGAGSAAA
jgi:RNA polymerase sigma factor (sigma-70 family)